MKALPEDDVAAFNASGEDDCQALMANRAAKAAEATPAPTRIAVVILL